MGKVVVLPSDHHAQWQQQLITKVSGLSEYERGQIMGYINALTADNKPVSVPSSGKQKNN